MLVTNMAEEIDIKYVHLHLTDILEYSYAVSA